MVKKTTVVTLNGKNYDIVELDSDDFSKINGDSSKIAGKYGENAACVKVDDVNGGYEEQFSDDLKENEKTDLSNEIEKIYYD